jgi:UTP--glucose-1-phosphate uridylyltransferase
VPREKSRQYGIVSSTRVDERTEKVTAIVEKPAPQDAPSTLAVVGRYVLTPRLFELIGGVAAGAIGEIQLTDAISALLAYEPVFAYRFTGTRYDCGSKLGYLKASVDLGRKHPEVGAEFDAFLKETIVRS